jgi:ABC-2 type transport system permease protein
VNHTLQFWWGALRREWRRIAASRFLFWAAGPAPVLVFLLLISIFRQQVIRELPVALVDQDQSSLSAQLARMLDASSGLDLRYRLAEPTEAIRLVREGKIYGYIVVPRGLERSVLRGEPAEVAGFHNAAFLSAGGIVSREFRTVVATLSYGLKQQRLARLGAPPGPLEPVRVQSSALYNPQLNYSYFLLVALLPAMLQILITLATVEAVGAELRWSSAPEWLQSAGNRVLPALAGKLTPYLLLYLVNSLIMLTLLFLFVGLPLRGSLVSIALGSLLLVSSYLSIGVFLTAITANLRVATSLAAFFTGPALAYMGISFPQMGMPLFGRIWGNLLPVSHYMRLLIGQTLRGEPFSHALPELGILLVFVLVPLGLAVLRLRTVVRDPRYLGRA